MARCRAAAFAAWENCAISLIRFHNSRKLKESSLRFASPDKLESAGDCSTLAPFPQILRGTRVVRQCWERRLCLLFILSRRYYILPCATVSCVRKFQKQWSFTGETHSLAGTRLQGWGRGPASYCPVRMTCKGVTGVG